MYNQTAEAEGTPGLAANRIKAKWPELLGLITLCVPAWGLPQSRLDHASGLSEFQHHRSGGLSDRAFSRRRPPYRGPVLALRCQLPGTLLPHRWPASQAASPSQRRLLERPYTRVDVGAWSPPPPTTSGEGGQGAESFLQEPWMGQVGS